ncbi:unnamed protein product, partial [Iphiclides podalirius]
MTPKTFLFLQVLFIIKAIAAYPCSPCAGPLAAGTIALEEIAATSGGAFIVATGSPVPPTGISVLSENTFEGTLSVEGRLPFLGTVSLEGALPTVGAGAVSYGCGNGNVGIVSAEIASTGLTTGRTFGARGLGCGALL